MWSSFRNHKSVQNVLGEKSPRSSAPFHFVPSTLRSISRESLRNLGQCILLHNTVSLSVSLRYTVSEHYLDSNLSPYHCPWLHSCECNVHVLFREWATCAQHIFDFLLCWKCYVKTEESSRICYYELYRKRELNNLHMKGYSYIGRLLLENADLSQMPWGDPEGLKYKLHIRFQFAQRLHTSTYTSNKKSWSQIKKAQIISDGVAGKLGVWVRSAKPSPKWKTGFYVDKNYLQNTVTNHFLNLWN